MSSQEEREMTSPRITVSREKSMQRTRKLLGSRNTRTFVTLKGKEKENRIGRNTTKVMEKSEMQRLESAVSSLNATTFSNGKPQAGISQEEDSDFCNNFQMLKLHQDEIDDEEMLSMSSVDFRPSSCSTLDLHEEQNFQHADCESESEFENLNTEDIGQIITIQADQSELTTHLVSGDHDIASPRLPVTKLVEERNNEDSENRKKGDLNLMDSNVQKKVESEIEYESERKTKSQVKTAWELNDKYLLTTDFPAEVWDEELKSKTLNTRLQSPDLLSASFPPLSAFSGLRRGSFPISPPKYWFSTSKTASSLPLLSGRQCKVHLPSSFPGVASPTSGSESEFCSDEPQREFLERNETTQKKEQALLKKTLEVLSPPGKQAKKLKTSSARKSPNSSGSPSPMLSSEHLAIKAASTEFLAARVVTQLNCAFKETVVDSNEEVTDRLNCVTPNLMPRRHSALVFRSNTSCSFEGKANSLILPSVNNECSKSLPNLTGHEKTKRVFVTFDKDYPSVKVVDLKSKSDLAHRCRVLNNKLTNEDSLVKAMLKDKVHKKSMIKKWIIASAPSI